MRSPPYKKVQTKELLDSSQTRATYREYLAEDRKDIYRKFP